MKRARDREAEKKDHTILANRLTFWRRGCAGGGFLPLSASSTTTTTAMMRVSLSTLPSELRLLARPLSAPFPRFFSSSPPSFRHPKLYFHQISPTSLALSFLPTPAPSLAFSPTTIGVLSTKFTSNPPSKVLPADFQENSDFRQLLHEVLSGEIAGDEVIQTLAVNRGDGFMFVSLLSPLLRRSI